MGLVNIIKEVMMKTDIDKTVGKIRKLLDQHSLNGEMLEIKFKRRGY